MQADELSVLNESEYKPFSVFFPSILLIHERKSNSDPFRLCDMFCIKVDAFSVFIIFENHFISLNFFEAYKNFSL